MIGVAGDQSETELFGTLGQLSDDRFAGNDRPRCLLASLIDHIGNEVGQLDIHLGQRLLEMLDRAQLTAQQHRALPRQGAQRTELILRAGWRRAFTNNIVKRRASSSSESGIQHIPVDSIATVSTSQAISQSAKHCKSVVKVAPGTARD